MNVQQSILGEIATPSGRTVSSVDVGALVRRLILFDKVIVKSIRLQEVPFLVRAFGKNGLSTLLRSGLLHFSCNLNFVIVDLSRNGVRDLPLHHFSFATAHATNPDKDLRSELRCLQSVTGLKNRERELLEEEIWNSLLWEPASYRQSLLDQMDFDFRANTPALKAALLEKLQAELGESNVQATQVQLEVEETSARVFHLKNKLSDSFGFTREKTHILLQDAASAVARLNQRLADMQAHSAITGFQDKDAPLLFGKLAGIIAPLNPKIAEHQFERIIELAGVPDFKPSQRVDVEALLKVRDSAECREFREWLCTVQNASDAEIKDMVASVKSKAAILASSTGGKLVRLAATTGVGLIPVIGPITGVVAGAIDSFLVDRVLPRSGVVAFLTETYPSLFVSA